jgi:hypothetical protein
MRAASLSCAAALCIAALPIEPAAAATEPLRAAIERCQARLDPEIDVGYARIAARCPELVRQLESSEWLQWLPRGWRDAGNDLSVRGLDELATLIERERLRELTGRRPGTAKLHEVLEGLEGARPERGARWLRFQHWFEAVFEQPAEEDGSTWLERMLRRATLSDVVIEALTFLAVALVVALALVIVVNELRVAGLFRRRRKRGPPVEVERRAVPRVTRAELELASPQERAGLLLRLVFERLQQAGLLARAASLTVNEAQHLVALPDTADRARLAELAAAAEHARFAARPAEAGVLARALAAGAELLAKLDTARARRT